jgi:hypothetical protein
MNTALLSCFAWQAPRPSPAPGHPWLDAGELQRSRWPGGGRLRVVSGRAWVTRAGALEDHFLAPGDTLDVPAGADLIVQADGPEPLRWRWDPRPTRPGAAR